METGLSGLYVATFRGTSQYFLCRFCLDRHRRTHLVLKQNYQSRVYRDNGEYTGSCFFKDVVNLVTTENPDSDIKQWIHCVRCNSRLGWKYVQVPLDHICAKARFCLTMDSVTFWDGNKELDVESGLPAVDADPGQGAPVQPLPAGDGQAAFVQPEEDEHANADHEDEPLEEDDELPAGFWYG